MASTAARIVMTGWFYCTVSLFFVISFVAQLLVFLLFLPFMLSSSGFREKSMSYIFQTCMALALFCLPFWKVKRLNQVPRDCGPHNLIVICNHVSGSDPWVVNYALFGWPTIYVMKSSLFKVPIIGWAMKLGNHVSVTFAKGRGGWELAAGAGAEIMQNSADALEKGCCLVVFPEGTRSVTGRLQPFKKGFFRFAVDHPDVRILPLGIHGTHNLWPVTSRLINQGTAYIKYGDLLSPEGMTADELRDKTHAAVFELLKASPDFDEQREQPLKQAASVRGHGL